MVVGLIGTKPSIVYISVVPLTMAAHLPAVTSHDAVF